MLGALSISQPPSWVMPGAFIDLDFCNKRYWNGFFDEGSGLTKTALGADGGAYGSGTVGLVPYTPTKSGLLLKGLGSQNRITDLGLWVERGGVNNLGNARDLSNAAWTKSNATCARDQAGNVIGEGANKASSMLATANGATVTQGATLTSRACIFSCYIMRLIGSGTISITSDNGGTWLDITSQVNSTGYTLVQNPVATLTNPIFGIQLGTSGDKIAVDFCQGETSFTGEFANLVTGHKASTPLYLEATPSTICTRGNQTTFIGQLNTSFNNGLRLVTDLFSYGGPWSMMSSFNGDGVADFLGSGGTRGPGMLVSDFTFPTAINCGGGVVGFSNSYTNRTSNFCNQGLGNWNIAVVACDNKGTTECLNGGSPSAQNVGNIPSLNPGSTHFNLFNNNAGGLGTSLDGSVGRVTFWRNALSASQMIEWTNLMGPYRTF